MVENSKAYWEQYWNKEKRNTNSEFLFHKLLQQYDLKVNNYFEFGCAPGNNMVYFANKYGCNVSGVDFIDDRLIKDYLDKERILSYQIFQEDVYDFETENKYDFVGSYGFIEHFDDPETIIKKHKEVVKDGGYLFIEVPNIRYINYLINKLLSKEILSKHNFSIMDLKKLREIILDEEFEEVFVNYYLTSYFQANSESGKLKKYKNIEKIYKIINFIMNKLSLDNIPNKFMSPYIIVLAKKKEKVKSL